MPRQYNWKEIQRVLDETVSKSEVMRRCGIRREDFTYAMQDGHLRAPEGWDDLKFANSPNHPAKGVSAQIIEALSENPRQNYQELADRLGCSGANITYHGQRMGLHQRLDSWIDWDEVQRVLDTTLNVSKTAKRCGVSSTSITLRIANGVLKRSNGFRTVPHYTPEQMLADHSETGKRHQHVGIIAMLLTHGLRKKKCECCGRHQRQSEPRSRLLVTYENGNNYDQRESNIILSCVRCNEPNMTVLEVVEATGTKVEFWKKVETRLGDGQTTVADAANHFGIRPRNIYNAYTSGRIKRPFNLSA